MDERSIPPNRMTRWVIMGRNVQNVKCSTVEQICRANASETEKARARRSTRLSSSRFDRLLGPSGGEGWQDLHDVVADGVQHQFANRVNVELPHDVRSVR